MMGERSFSGGLTDQVDDLLELNQEVANVIIESQKNVQKNERFSSLIKTYMEISRKDLDLCSALERCIRYARDGQLIIQRRLQEVNEDSGGNFKDLMIRTKEDLEKLQAGDDPFPEEFHMFLNSTFDGNKSLIAELDKQAREFNRTLRRMKAWMKVSTVLFAIGYFSVLILTGVSFVVTMPSPVEVLAGALSATIGSIGKWSNYYCKKREKEVQGLKANVTSVKISTCITLKDMDDIRILIDRWKSGIEHLSQKTDTILREEQEAEEMKKEWDVFAKIGEELRDRATRFGVDIRKGRAIILRKLVALNSSDEEKGNCLEIIM